jgi:hypothetical protein
MRRLFFISLTLLLTSVASYAEDAFEVEYIFERQELPKGSKCLDLYDNVKEVKYVLVPIELEKGTYEATIKRIDSNLYELKFGYNDVIYIETRYCYKYTSYGDKAILIVYDQYNYKKPKVVFI